MSSFVDGGAFHLEKKAASTTWFSRPQPLDRLFRHLRQGGLARGPDTLTALLRAASWVGEGGLSAPLQAHVVGREQTEQLRARPGRPEPRRVGDDGVTLRARGLDDRLARMGTAVENLIKPRL